MSESAAGTVVGVVGEDEDAVRAAVEAAGAEVVTGSPGTVLGADPDRLVAVGPESLPTLVAAGVPTAPVLPIDAGPGTPSVPLAHSEAGIGAFLAGDGGTVTVPVLGVAVDGQYRTRALADVMLVTAEPARISEYAVATGERAIAKFRADGVVAATPLGSHGYTRRVDGPVLAPGTSVAAVVPVAPFATDPDHWVVPLSDLELRVVRDEHPVELPTDHRSLGEISPEVPVSISVADSLTLATVPGSRPVFDADRDP